MFSTTILFAQSDDAGVDTVVKEKAYEEVDAKASVDQKQWRKHLQETLPPYIEKAMGEGMKAGQYSVQVKFIVEIDGSVTDVKAVKDPGYGFGTAAEEVVKQGPKWKPAELKSKKVRSYYIQPIVFIISEE